MSTTIRNKVEVKGGFVSGNYPGYMNFASPVAEYSETSVTSLSVSCVLAPNGKIYFIPGTTTSNSRAIVLDPLTGITEELDCGSWYGYGAVVAPDGIIYCFPGGFSSTIMTINPETHEVNTNHLSGVGSGYYDHNGARLHPNGKIYLTPYYATYVGVYDYIANTFSSTTTGLTGLPSSHSKWQGATLASNGKMYCGPYSHNSVLIIDPYTPSVDYTTIAGMTTFGGGTSNSGWRQGCLAPNGKIYFAPRDSSSVLIVDPSTDTADEATIAGLAYRGALYGQGRLAPDGKIYCPPIAATNVLVIDPETDTIDTTTYTGVGVGTTKYFCSALAPNGKIYAVSFGAGYDKLLELVPGGSPTLPIEPILSPYINNG